MKRARYSVAALALAVTAGAPGAAASVSSRGSTVTVDQTVACRVITALDTGTFGFSAQVKEPPVRYNGGTATHPGAIGASNGSQLVYAGASSEMFASGRTIKSGYYFDSTVCRRAPPIQLSRSGLPSLGVYSRAGNTQVSESCDVARDSIVTVRLRVVLSTSGKPSAAQLAIRAGNRQRPAAFINWTPTRFTAFASAACQPH